MLNNEINQQAFNELIEELKQYKGAYVDNPKDLNFLMIPKTHIEALEENADRYNKLYQLCIKANLNLIIRTKSMGIKNDLFQQMIRYKYSEQRTGNGRELCICLHHIGNYRIQYKTSNKSKDGVDLDVSGNITHKEWVKECKKIGIDFETYATPKNERPKNNEDPLLDTIHKPDIALYGANVGVNNIYEKVNHIDFHKAYLSGLLVQHNEFYPIVDKWNKKNTPTYKTKLAVLSGWWRCKWCNYKWFDLARTSINDFYKKYDEVKQDLLDKGFTILATNTDGIWYYKENGEVYHNDKLYEGEGLGHWSNDYTNCKIRFKSKGCYEFIDNNNKYHPVVRGITKLDSQIDRKDWKWGYIFLTDIKTYRFEDGIGIIWDDTFED